MSANILTNEQIDFFHREGYIALGPITTPEELEWMVKIYDRLFEQRAGREIGSQFDLAGTDEEGTEALLPQILSPSHFAPEFQTSLIRKNALIIARQLLGPDADYHGDHAILKPGRIGAPTPWHQDEAYWDGGCEYNSVSFWIPLQPATKQNGCMEFVPGSHKLSVLPHHSIGHDPRIHGLEVDEADTENAVACPLPAGGATIHHSRTLHYTGPNISDEPRRAYILIFGLPPRPARQKRDFYWNTVKQTARDERARASQSV